MKIDSIASGLYEEVSIIVPKVGSPRSLITSSDTLHQRLPVLVIVADGLE
jgi:hypothetical protein